MVSDVQIERATPGSGLWPRDSHAALLLAKLLWLVPVLVITVSVAINPVRRSVTLGSYHVAAANWWTGQSLYVGPGGMNYHYLPHFAVLYSPFHFLPLRICEVLWRLCAAATIVAGLWRLVHAVFPLAPERPFFWATLLAMPLSMSSVQNGNANAIFGGVVLWSIVAILKERWWWALGLMALGTAIKPLGIVLLLLAPLVYGAMRWRLPWAVVALGLFPFLFGRPAYVLGQYQGAWRDLQSCAVVTEHRFADVNGVMRTFGTALPPGISKMVRVFAGGLTAILWLWGAKRLRAPLAALWLYALAAAYLMLFNPMTEANSYVILAPALGIWGACFLFHPEMRTEGRLGWVIVFMALTMGLLPNVLRPLFGNHFALFWHPFMTAIFIATLARFTFRPPDEEALRQQSANSLP